MVLNSTLKKYKAVAPLELETSCEAHNPLCTGETAHGISAEEVEDKTSPHLPPKKITAKDFYNGLFASDGFFGGSNLVTASVVIFALFTVAALSTGLYFAYTVLYLNDSCNSGNILPTRPRFHRLSVEDQISFIAIGDWGGTDVEPFYKDPQAAAAAGMEKVAEHINSQFVLALGDNFYHSGLSSLDSDRFQTTFEDVYSGPHLQNSWFVTAGNHDYMQDICPQIEYTEVSDRWEFPSKFYAESFTNLHGNLTVDIIMIDTVNLAGISHIQQEGQDGYFDPLPEASREVAQDKWDWLEDFMETSEAQYLLIGGHYPVYSACQHGTTGKLHTLLKPLLEKFGAHYLSGHDHCLVHVAEQGVQYYLTGMASECCYESSQKDSIPEGALKWYIAKDNVPNHVKAGFLSITATANELTATFHDQDGNALYSPEPVLPRRSDQIGVNMRKNRSDGSAQQRRTVATVVPSGEEPW